MSIISLPRTTTRPATRPASRPASRTKTTGARAARHVRTTQKWALGSVQRRSLVVVIAALAIALGGSMLQANRQIELHNLQSQLLQDQSAYAEQVGSLSNLSAPSQIASNAGALHLVSPTVVIQVPSTSLDAPLPLPKFLGYAPATSRTIR